MLVLLYYPRDGICCHRLSVRPSVTCRCCTKMAKRGSYKQLRTIAQGLYIQCVPKTWLIWLALTSKYINQFLANVNSRSRSLLAVAIPSVCCLSVVCDVGAPYSGVWTFRQFFSPYDSPETLLFWCQKSLVGDAPFPLKFAFKVTHPLSNSAISTNIGS